jgi:lipopolysaccharide export system permease protein
MNILHRYIQKQVIVMTALVTLIIAGLQIFITLIEEMHSIGRGGYDVSAVLNFVLLTLPHLVYPLFPVAALIGCLIALGRLAAQSELLVMQASGISQRDITLSILRTTVLMLLVVTFIGEYVAPLLHHKAVIHKDEAINQRPFSAARQGGWIRDEGSFIHIDAVLPGNQVSGVLQYQFKEKQLVSALTAESASYIEGKWWLHNVAETQFHKNSSSVVRDQLRLWPVSFDPDLVGLGTLTAAENNLVDIHHYIRYLKKGGLSASNYEFALWKRLFQPLVTLVMIGLAVPFIFGPLRTATMGFRILVGVIVGFSFYTFNEFLGPFSLVYQIPPLIAAALPIALFLLIDLYFYLRGASRKSRA